MRAFYGYARSREQSAPTTIIISADRPKLAKAELARRRKDLTQDANRVATTVQNAVGFWEGKREHSLVVSGFLQPVQGQSWAERIAREYEQDAFIRIDSARFVWLYSKQPDGSFKESPLGNLCTSPKQPKHVPGWTFLKGKGYYYTVPGAASEPEVQE